MCTKKWGCLVIIPSAGGILFLGLFSEKPLGNIITRIGKKALLVDTLKAQKEPKSIITCVYTDLINGSTDPTRIVILLLEWNLTPLGVSFDSFNII